MALPGNPEKNAAYADDSLNLIYELLFCDNPDLYKGNNSTPGSYPWNILFAIVPDVAGLQKITTDKDVESRSKILAYNQLRKIGKKIGGKELLGVIVEVGLEEGLDVLASFSDGSARYINYTGRMIIWEAPDQESTKLTKQLFEECTEIVAQIGPWDKPRRPRPETGMVRITFLVSDGIYFGEGPINVLFNDPLARNALATATSLMQFLMEKSLSKKQ